LFESVKWLAVLPLRGGSKSIPQKNIKFIGGKPLFAWALESALNSKIFDEIIISSDSQEILDLTKKLYPEVSLDFRPKELASDNASSEAVLIHIMQNHNCDVISLVQATSPLTEPEDFIKARQKFEEESADSLVTAVSSKRFFWNHNSEPINYDPSKRPRRQDFDGWLMENGAFYFTRSDILAAEGSRLGGKISIYEMEEITGYEIDEPADWLILEQLLLRYKRRKSFSDIQLLACDVDGTLTDGGMYYTAEGEWAKKFNSSDWHGLKRLQDEGQIKPVIITREDSPAVHSRVKKVGIENYYFGVKDKLSLLKEISEKFSVPFSKMAFIGDDEGDAECMASVGFSAAPADAQQCILKIAHYICKREGGAGAVREVCDLFDRDL
jgi:N-acylneuraminate cytidylyltransferase